MRLEKRADVGFKRFGVVTALGLMALAAGSCSGRMGGGMEPVLAGGSRVAVFTYVYTYDADKKMSYMKAPYEFDAIIENYLLNMGYKPVDRSQIEQVMAEQKLSSTGAIKESEAVKLGQMAGAQYILITMIQYALGGAQSMATRLLDAQSSEVLSAMGTQVDQFEKSPEKFWAAIFFRRHSPR